MLHIDCYHYYFKCVSAAVYLTGSAPDVSTMDAFNNSSAELDDWLSRLDHMIVTQRVTVGDLSEISDLILKLKVCANECLFQSL